eukprot:scaffold59341_cov75-Phaeocystis_antarctica.AAC.1
MTKLVVYNDQHPPSTGSGTRTRMTRTKLSSNGADMRGRVGGTVCTLRRAGLSGPFHTNYGKKKSFRRLLPVQVPFGNCNQGKAAEVLVIKRRRPAAL